MEQLAMQMACELVLTREVPVAGEKSLCKIERQMSMNHDGLGQLHNELQVTKVRYEPQWKACDLGAIAIDYLWL